MWEVEFFMPEALPDDMVASADAYACVDTYLRKAFGINNINFPHFVGKNPSGVNKLWEVEFFMPEAWPYNMVERADA